ncbi:hypothetical protein C8Q74DRAFT_1220750 [Fomes fomentarius]|nr:hypothetical protein C8Q74DRAFT_1220750 [Fomes fomentarius]
MFVPKITVAVFAFALAAFTGVDAKDEFLFLSHAFGQPAPRSEAPLRGVHHSRRPALLRARTKPVYPRKRQAADITITVTSTATPVASTGTTAMMTTVTGQAATVTATATAYRTTVYHDGQGYRHIHGLCDEDGDMDLDEVRHVHGHKNYYR